MFDSLDETMKHDAEVESTPKQRALVWISVAVLSIIIFGGIFLAVQLLE